MSLANNHARDFRRGRPLVEHGGARRRGHPPLGARRHGRELGRQRPARGAGGIRAQRGIELAQRSADRPAAGVTQLAATHDIVIVSFHGGAEGNGAEVLPFAREIFAGEDRGNVVEFAHAMIDAGADLVLGHGPHVVRPMELYHDRLIAYSLGNFATYYGISVDGIRGIAPILLCTLDDDGRFVSGRIEATTQIPPAGPSLDAAGAVVTLLRTLTDSAFPTGTLDIRADGTLAIRAPAVSQS
jgi:hypothetical protein